MGLWRSECPQPWKPRRLWSLTKGHRAKGEGRSEGLGPSVPVPSPMPYALRPMPCLEHVLLIWSPMKGRTLLVVTMLGVGLFSTRDASGTADGLAQTTRSIDETAWRHLSTQVALDRAGFSPGELDAEVGSNTRSALAAFQTARQLPLRDEIDDETSAALGETFSAPLTSYTITTSDAAGPFIERLPDDMMEKAALPAMSYGSVLELLGERFHASPKLLQRINPTARFAEGETISVPNVVPFEVPTGKSGSTNERPTGKDRSTSHRTKAHIVTVMGKTMTLTVQSPTGEVVFQAPVTVGSVNDPMPTGEWTVNSLSVNPPFNYNPALFWDADPSHAKARIAPGPNNPVGVLWIDLSKEHYGIHGTPEPSRVGHTESHGCIRLTNWDVMRLSTFMAPGTKVVLR
jgi:lipoprotein-anchoring transpeptidase ErfK/SrfK